MSKKGEMSEGFKYLIGLILMIIVLLTLYFFIDKIVYMKDVFINFLRGFK